MTKFLRPALADDRATYVPGEQPPPDSDIVKLNTNESPEPPPAEVTAAARTALARIHKYPSPWGEPARTAAAEAWGLSSGEVLVTNGSDEALRMIFQTFVDPGEAVAFSPPTYSYYEVLIRQFAGRPVEVPRERPESLPVRALSEVHAKVVFLCSPDAPLGTQYPDEEIRAIAARPDRLIILDEAYLPFAEREPALRGIPNLLRLRTLSKGDALAGLRLGFALGQADLIRDLSRVKESYNVDRVAAEVGAAALRPGARAGREERLARIRRVRQALAEGLEARGLRVYPSQANYVFACMPETGPKGSELVRALAARGVLVRHFPDTRLPDGIRVTVGSEAEIRRFLAELDVVRKEKK